MGKRTGPAGTYLFAYLNSPQLNLIERLWNYMRAQMTRNQFYESLKVQCQEIADWLTTLPFARFCSLMGIDEAGFQFS